MTYANEQLKAAFFKLYNGANLALTTLNDISECGWCPLLRNCDLSNGSRNFKPPSDCREKILKWCVENAND